MGEYVFLKLINLIILLNNLVYSQFIECDIYKPNSCENVTIFNGEIYQEKFICHYWNNNRDTICIPTSLICKSNEDCHNNHEKILHKRDFFNSDYLIFYLCIIIPLLFVVGVTSCVIYAKKYYERSELKNAQSTSASSVSSLYYSKTVKYYRGTNTNGSIHSANIETINVPNNYMGYNMTLNSGISTMTNMGFNGESNADYNSHLYKPKQKLKEFGTVSMQSSQSSLTRTNNSPQISISTELKNNGSLKQLQMDTYSSNVTIIPDTSNKSETITIPSSSPNHDINYNKDGKRSNVSIDNSSSRTNKSYSNHSRDHSHDYDHVNDQKNKEIKKKEKRISISPPLKDWNDSYYTVSPDVSEEKKSKYRGSSRSNKNKKYKNKYIENDNNSPIHPPSISYKTYENSKYKKYSDHGSEFDIASSHS